MAKEQVFLLRENNVDVDTEENKAIKTISTNNSIDELNQLLSIKSANVQNCLWNVHQLNRTFMDLWVDHLTKDIAHQKQWEIKHVIFYPNYSQLPTIVRMQCFDVVDFGGLVEYKHFIELKPDERVVPIKGLGGIRDTYKRIHFIVHEKRSFSNDDPCEPYFMLPYGGSIPPFREFIIKKDEYEKLWKSRHMSIMDVCIYTKENTPYFSSYTRRIATCFLESKEALMELKNDIDSGVRQEAVRKLNGDNIEIIRKVSEAHKEEEQRRMQEQQMQEMLHGSILFFDTETTGKPLNYKASVTDLYNWPRLVQLAWIMADKDGNMLKKKSVIIKPDGFSIPDDSVAVHGITTERALRDGSPINDVLEEFATDMSLAEHIVGHNIDFDQHIVGAELCRLGMDFNALMDKPCTCTMKASTNFCAIPNPNTYFGGYKWPSLQELYQKLFNRSFEDAHDALADITATKECYFELKQRGIIQ